MRYCITRNDLSVETFSLETKTYFLHDICNYVVEKNLHYTNGFWGMLAKGSSINTLKGKTNPQTTELRFIEQIVGPVQSVYSGYLPQDLFEQFIAHLDFALPINFLSTCISMINTIMANWNALPLNDQLVLEWNLPLQPEYV
jgi:hypothetical protein